MALALGAGAGHLVSRAPTLFYALTFVLGAAMLPLYSLAIAHANDRLERSQFVEASAGLLMINAGASIFGPLLASAAMTAAGPNALFFYTALAHAAMAVYAFLRIGIKEPAPVATRDTFRPVPQGSPALLPLDPRGPDHDTHGT